MKQEGRKGKPGFAAPQRVPIMDKAPRMQETQDMNTAPTATDAGTAPVDPRAYKSFAEFYPFYLSEHANRTCRRLHFVGSSLALGCLVMLLLSGNAWWLVPGVLVGYAFAWIGHFGFEKNKPASFKRPLYSFMGDWAMYWDILRGRIAF
jgi:hypothetical protein